MTEDGPNGPVAPRRDAYLREGLLGEHPGVLSAVPDAASELSLIHI